MSSEVTITPPTSAKYYDQQYSSSQRHNSKNTNAILSPKSGIKTQDKSSASYQINLQKQYQTETQSTMNKKGSEQISNQKSNRSSRVGSTRGKTKQSDVYKESAVKQPAGKQNKRSMQQVPQQLPVSYLNQNELINIKVKSTTNSQDKLEVWSPVQNQNQQKIQSRNNRNGGLEDISFQDSDIADEFEYRFDPSYGGSQIRANPKRATSPQVRMEVHIIDSKSARKAVAKTPRFNRKQDTSTPNVNVSIEDCDDEDRVIKACCRQFCTSHKCKTTGKKQRRRKFMRRMQEDIKQRGQRDRTFEEVKETIYQMKVERSKSNSSPQRKNSTSPERNNRQASVRNITPQREELDDQEFTYHQFGSSPRQPHGDISVSTKPNQPFLTEQKKLKKGECENLYNRMMQYEHRKRKAIEMMQDARRRDEDLDLQVIHQKKVSKNQLKQCYNRLAEDAKRRKVTLAKQQHQLLLQEEEQKKTMFKPKTNHNSSSKLFIRRDHVIQTNKSSMQGGDLHLSPSSGLNLEQRLNIYQQDAHAYKSQNLSQSSHRQLTDEHDE